MYNSYTEILKIVYIKHVRRRVSLKFGRVLLLLLLSHLPLRLVMGEAQVEASPGVVGQDKARMIGIPLLLQVVAINPVGSKW